MLEADMLTPSPLRSCETLPKPGVSPSSATAISAVSNPIIRGEKAPEPLLPPTQVARSSLCRLPMDLGRLSRPCSPTVITEQWSLPLGSDPFIPQARRMLFQPQPGCIHNGQIRRHAKPLLHNTHVARQFSRPIFASVA